MTQTNQISDNLTLSIIKEHIYVDIANDDTLIQVYSEASLKLCQNFLFDSVLYTTYNSEDYENIIQGTNLVLDLKFKPNEVKIMTSAPVPDNILTSSYKFEPSNNLVSEIIVNKDFYTYIDNKLCIDISNIYNLDSTITLETEVSTGSNPISEVINQARMIMIAGWYANREPSTSMAVNKLPFSAELLLSTEQNSFI